MKNRFIGLLSLTLFFAGAQATLHAQLVADGATATLDNVTNTVTGNVTVGTNGPFTALILTNGALLTNTFNGVIGLNTSSKSNSVWLTAANSRWLMGGELYVGFSGAANQLVVSNGGVAQDAFGYLGFNFTSTNNMAVVTGTGSLWTNAGQLQVGSAGSGNQLVVSNGGVVNSSVGHVGNSVTSSNNLAVVTGPGSVWGTAGLLIGNSGPGNQLLVSSGGVVQTSSSGTVGNNATSSNNLALVTGAGSLWINVGGLSVGYHGSGNQLVVTNGGMVQNTGFGYLGYNPSSSNNVAVVTGAGSGWTNLGDLNVGNVSSGNQLVVTNGGVVSSGKGSIGLAVGSACNVAVVTGPGSLWNSGTELRVGDTGSGNRLVMSSGGKVRNSIGIIGRFGSNNVAVVTGAGSGWTNVGDFTFGYFGSGNQLVVTNGGVVQNSLRVYVGRDIASSNNLATVTGAGSVWSSADELLVGYFGSGNQLVVSNGGVVQNLLSGYVGFSGSNNVAVVTGAGSVWSNVSLLRVGADGSGNQLTVSDGGVVRSLNGTLGTSVTSSNNLAVVTGAGSQWTNATGLQVGLAGSGNQLVVTNGGTVFAFNTVTIGLNSTSTKNRLITDGGTLRVANVGFAVFDIRRGTNVLNAGTNEVDRLVMTNAAGLFEFNGGTLTVRTSTVNNGVVFTVGNGSSAATYRMSGIRTDRHNFANGLLITSNAVLTGNGTVIGSVTVQSGGALSPGTSVGTVVFSNSPSLQGATLMEISKTGSTLTNDQLQVNGALTYGGTLTVTSLGDAPTAGDRFPLFTVSSYAGAFSSANLPSLAPGLSWTNKLLLDGSIEVVMAAAPSRPQFSSINPSGANLVMSGSGGPTNGTYYVLTSTNVALPLTNWTPVLTNQFDSNGNFVFTNAINPAVPQRFYALQVAPTVFFSYGTVGTDGSVWRALTGLTSATIGSVLATWKDEGFNDSTWIVLSTQTGYGDGDENDPFVRVDYDAGIGGTQSGPSYLFRATFTIANVNAIASVTGEVKYDDGAVVYVNGTEILRTTNLDPAAALTDYANFNGAAATENATNPLNVPLNLLHNGANTIAVEVHQQNNTSPDVTFDLKLKAN